MPVVTDRVDALRKAVEELYKHLTGDALSITLDEGSESASIEITRQYFRLSEPQYQRRHAQ